MSIRRFAKPAPLWWNTLKTVLILTPAAVLLFWAVPELIVHWQNRNNLDRWYFPQHQVVGLLTFASGAVLILWSGCELAMEGAGTPLPSDAPRYLVLSGPYAWIRNPMIAGVAVGGLGVFLYTGSVLVLGYFFAIALFWQLVMRPVEEDQLQRVFGRQFELYRRSVRCWIPMRSPWSPPPQSGPISLDDLPAESKNRRRRRVP